MKLSKKSIIRCVERNIERDGSLYGDPFTCLLCVEAEEHAGFDHSQCDVCPLWRYLKQSIPYMSDCANIKYKGKILHSLDSKLRNNKPALRALLLALVNNLTKKDS